MKETPTGKTARYAARSALLFLVAGWIGYFADSFALAAICWVLAAVMAALTYAAGRESRR